MTTEQPAADGRPVRTFIGLPIVLEVANQLARLVADVEDCVPLRPVAPIDIHLTLVPPWNEPSPETAIERLGVVAVKFAPFTLSITRAGYGPNPARPRLIWADCSAPEELTALHAALLEAFGQTDTRPFRPHVTLARLLGSRPKSMRTHLFDRQLDLAQQVCAVALFQSPPAGEQNYRLLASCPLSVQRKP